MDIGLKEILSKDSINNRARENWNNKSKTEKLRNGRKYRHIFAKKNEEVHDWTDLFENLSVSQRKLLVKGEVIRTYDSLPNHDKTKIMRDLELSMFASKWYKLPKTDKNKLLKLVY